MRLLSFKLCRTPRPDHLGGGFLGRVGGGGGRAATLVRALAVRAAVLVLIAKITRTLRALVTRLCEFWLRATSGRGEQWLIHSDLHLSQS